MIAHNISVQKQCQSILNKLLLEEDNKYCADCNAKAPRWASWNLGVFLCLHCAGIHRQLGVHISKVKSITLDTWTAYQVECMSRVGNRKAHLFYEAKLPPRNVPLQRRHVSEVFIRAKYEERKYVDDSMTAVQDVKMDDALIPTIDSMSNKITDSEEHIEESYPQTCTDNLIPHPINQVLNPINQIIDSPKRESIIFKNNTPICLTSAVQVLENIKTSNSQVIYKNTSSVMAVENMYDITAAAAPQLNTKFQSPLCDNISMLSDRNVSEEDTEWSPFVGGVIPISTTSRNNMDAASSLEWKQPAQVDVLGLSQSRSQEISTLRQVSEEKQQRIEHLLDLWQQASNTTQVLRKELSEERQRMEVGTENCVAMVEKFVKEKSNEWQQREKNLVSKLQESDYALRKEKLQFQQMQEQLQSCKQQLTKEKECNLKLFILLQQYRSGFKEIQDKMCPKTSAMLSTHPMIGGSGDYAQDLSSKVGDDYMMNILTGDVGALCLNKTESGASGSIQMLVEHLETQLEMSNKLCSEYESQLGQAKQDRLKLQVEVDTALAKAWSCMQEKEELQLQRDAAESKLGVVQQAANLHALESQEKCIELTDHVSEVQNVMNQLQNKVETLELKICEAENKWQQCCKELEDLRVSQQGTDTTT